MIGLVIPTFFPVADGASSGGPAEANSPEAVTDTAAIYDELASGLLRYAAGLTQDSDLARDAVQEVFLRYFIQRRHGREIDDPRAWLYHVTRNYLLEKLGSAAATREVGAEGIELAGETRSDPDAAVRRWQAARAVRQALTAREMECAKLRAEGMSYAEIAGAMGIASGTVGALLARVHGKLRRLTGESREAKLGAAEAMLLDRGDVFPF
jgi:RNA polymerase sigma factor (sigma-70 family)